MDEQLFKRGSVEDMAQMASRELQKQRPDKTPQETDEEVLEFITSQLQKGRQLDDIVIDLVEIITPDPKKQRELLLSIRAKIERKLEGAGKILDLAND